MKRLNQLALVLTIWASGEYISLFIQNIIVIPGSIIGMILLFILLQFKIVKLSSIEDISDFLLKNMTIFFI